LHGCPAALDQPGAGRGLAGAIHPIAERSGLILPIGAWVLEQACVQMGARAQEMGRPVKVAVNLSPRQFYQKSSLGTIRRCLAQYRVPDGCLELEITETALMSREEEVDALMHDIRAFVRDLDRDEDSAAIALSIVDLARGLKLKVVAEGVETEAQLAVLRSMACDEYQGFLFSRPVERGDVPLLLGRAG
jgi:EAL domain-containing protein (putative c-di-GMP-specific phosphodiesterase class I)